MFEMMRRNLAIQTFNIGAMNTVKPIKIKIIVPVTRCSLWSKITHLFYVKCIISFDTHLLVLALQSLELYFIGQLINLVN